MRLGDAAPPHPLAKGATGDSPPLHSPHSRLALLAVAGGECEWRWLPPGRCLPGGSRLGGCRPLSTPAEEVRFRERVAMAHLRLRTATAGGPAEMARSPSATAMAAIGLATCPPQPPRRPFGRTGTASPGGRGSHRGGYFSGGRASKLMPSWASATDWNEPSTRGRKCLMWASSRAASSSPTFLLSSSTLVSSCGSRSRS